MFVDKLFDILKATFIIWFLWLTEQIKIHSHWGFGPKNDLHLTCPSNLRALPETNGLPARIHASFKRYLVKQYQGPVISLSKKTASQLGYKWPYKGIAGIFQREEGTVPHPHYLPYLPNVMSTATLIFFLTLQFPKVINM